MLAGAAVVVPAPDAASKPVVVPPAYVAEEVAAAVADAAELPAQQMNN